MSSNLNDFPQIKQLFDELMERKEKVRLKSKPLWDRYNVLQAQYDPINNEMREIAKKIHAIERPVLPEIDMQLSAIARALGGRRLSDNPTPPTTPEPSKEEEPVVQRSWLGRLLGK